MGSEKGLSNFFVIANSEKDLKQEITQYIQDYIRQKGGKCRIQNTSCQGLEACYNYTNPKEIPKDTDAILVLGGDGTVIQAAHDVVDCNVPILGVNLGTLGYLAEIDRHNIMPALDNLMSGNYEIEERMMLEGCNCRVNEEQCQVALNDVVITRKGHLRVVKYHIYVNEQFLTSFQADGMIVATPTGSTGYSLSAGGPIVSPNAHMIVITPICPHTLNRTSVVLEGEDRVRIVVESSEKSGKVEAVASFDAAHGMELCGGDSIEIQASKKTTKMIKISKDSFLQVLSKKMRG